MSKNKLFEVPKFTKNDLDKFIKKFQFVLSKDYIKKINFFIINIFKINYDK